MTLARTWSSDIWTWPTATPRHNTFLSWNLIVDRTSVSLLVKSSAGDTGVGNLPAVVQSVIDETTKNEGMIMDVPLERPGPRRRGICLMSASEAKKASYFFASF